MIEKEIIDLREKLNKSIAEGENYEKIYELSVKLDKLISKYYKKGEEKKII